MEADTTTGEIQLSAAELEAMYTKHDLVIKTPKSLALGILAEYENIAAQLDLIKSDMAQARSAVIPDEIKFDLDSIDAEFLPRIAAGQARMDALKKDVQAAGKLVGETVNGNVWQVAYKKGSWKISDIEGLLQLAIQYPAIMNYIGKSDPSAAVQVRRGGK